MSGTDRSPDGVVAADQRQFEAHLVEPITGAELAERHVVGQRAERGLDHGSPARSTQASRSPRSIRRQASSDSIRVRSSCSERLGGEVGGFEHPVDERADVHAAGQVGQRQGDVAQCLLRFRVPSPASAHHPGTDHGLVVERRPPRARCRPGRSCEPAVIPLYEVRRHCSSRVRSNDSAASTGMSRVRTVPYRPDCRRDALDTDLTVRGGGDLFEPCDRLGVRWWGEPSAATTPSSSRSNSRRDSGESFPCQVPAHHTTA